MINKKILLWVMGSIILGAMGSGLWELAVKPSLSFIVEFFIDVVLSTFVGIQNAIYEQIASLDREITGRIIVSFGMGAMMGTVTALMIKVFKSQKDNKTSADSQPSKLYIALLGISVFVFTGFTAAQTNYVIKKQNDYIQLSAIIRPYVSNDQNLKLHSEFSLIASIEDYDNLMSKMRVIAAENGINLPYKLK